MYKIITACFLLVLPLLVNAGEESKRKNVEELLVLTNAEASIDTIYSQVSQMMRRLAAQAKLNQSNKEIFEKYNSKIISEMKKEVNWKKLKGPMVDNYMKHYTEKEIKDMVAFYKSDTGRSMVKKAPEVMRDSMLISQTMLKSFIPKMNALMEEMKKELKEAGEGNKK